MAEVILIVDDEEPVRRTFRDWLDQSGFGCQVLTASDAESALTLANQHAVDLAILDWNLGAGSDGLQLLEDLAVFHSDVVAILVTGFANQATPLDAMRKGVRDYLDKNRDLNRATFLAAIRKQLDRIAPAKRERHFHQVLVNFREAVEKVLPLVRSAKAMQDPVPLPEAVSRLLRFVMKTTHAADGVLLVRHYDPDRQPTEDLRVYDAEGKLLAGSPLPFARSVAGSVVSMGESCVMNELDQASSGGALELQPFERGRKSLLAAPLNVAPTVQVVLELFDKQPAGATFDTQDQAAATAAADVGAEMLRQALAERRMQQVLFDAVAAALAASESLTTPSSGTEAERREQPPPPQVLEQLRQSLSDSPAAEETLQLAEAVRVLAVRHGPTAVRHLIRQVKDLQRLLDEVSGFPS